MPPAGKGPSYTVWKYHSNFAQHSMTICTRQWDSALGDNGHGGFHGWALGTIDAQDMYDAMIAVLLPFFPVTVQIDQILTYNVNDFGSENVIADIYVPEDAIGTADPPGWYKAVSTTLNMFDSEFHDFKIVMLDSASHNNFDREPPGSLSAAGVALAANAALGTNAWSSRWGKQPTTVRGITRTLNDALRQQYDMG